VIEKKYTKTDWVRVVMKLDELVEKRFEELVEKAKNVKTIDGHYGTFMNPEVSHTNS
jgi:hypothetical protein